MQAPIVKTLVYADLHATVSSERCRLNSKLSLQQYRVDKFYDQIKSIYDKEKCNALWDLGDTTDDRTSIPMPTLDSIVSNLDKFPKNEYNIKIIGNHEQYLKNTTINAGKLFSNCFKKIINGIEKIDVGGTVFSLICAAFPEDEGITSEVISNSVEQILDDGRKPVLLGHFTVKGCKLNNSEAIRGIDKSILDGIELSLLGDIHKPQFLSKKAVYVGSPFQQNFGEEGDKKRIFIVEIYENSVKINPIYLEGFPEYHTLTVDEFSELKPEGVEETEDRYRVVIKNDEESNLFNSNPLSVYATPVHDYKIDGTNLSKNSVQELGLDYSFKSILERYVRKNYKKDINVLEEDLVNCGVDIAS